MPLHINASFDSIADFVIIAGDPIRTQNMSNKLNNVKLVSKTRNMFIYTGYYKGVKVSLASSGIGFSSIAIYVYELYKFYQVKTIIRVGTCGRLNNHNNLWDILNVNKAIVTEPFLSDFYTDLSINSDQALTKCIKTASQLNKINLFPSNAILSDKHFYFSDIQKMIAMQKIYQLDAVEMEAYALFVYAKLFNASAACLLTVTDIIDLHALKKKYKSVNKISNEEREKGLWPMFKIALETSLLWKKKKTK